MAWAKVQSQRMVAHAQTLAQQAGRPYLYLDRPQRKDDLAQKIARQDRLEEGLVCVLRCLEHSPSFRLTVGHGRPQFHFARPLARTFYFYYLDRDLGLIHLRLPTLFPFALQVVNGHDYLARRMVRERLGFVQQDNVFTELDAPQRAQELADGFAQEDWPARLRTLARRVNPLLQEVLQKFAYYWVTDHAEYATDLIFTSRQALGEVYPRLLQHGVLNFAVPDILGFLGKRLHPRYDGQVLTECRHDRIPGARLKHRVGANWLKRYDKLGLVLRLGTVINDPAMFRVRRRRIRHGHPEMVWCPMNKGVANLYRYQEVAQAANGRYLDALATVAPAAPAPVHRLVEPCRRHDRPYAGFNPARRGDLQLFQLLLDGAHALRGFRNADLRTRLFPHPAHAASDPPQRRREAAAVGRILKRLHVRGLVLKVPHSRRWHLTAAGRTTLSATLTAYRACITLAAA